MKSIEKNSREKSKLNIGGFYKNSLQNKILIPFIILIILTGGIISYVSYTFSVENTTKELSKNAESQMVSMNDSFELFFSNISNILDRFASNDLLVNYKSKDKEELLQIFKETQETTPSAALIYTGTADGEIIDYPVLDRESDYNVKERPWYQNAVDAEGEIVWSEPYPDAATGDIIVTASKAYYNGNKLAGVMAADILIDTLIDMMDDITIGETGYAVILDNTGKYVAHPEEDYIGQDESDEEYYNKIKESGEQGLVEYQFDGEDKVMGFVKNPTTGWILGGTVYIKDFQKQAQSIITPIAIALVVVLIIAIIVSLLTTRRITNPIKTVMERMESIADGDLSQSPLETKSKDEIGQLVNATNEMNERM